MTHGATPVRVVASAVTVDGSRGPLPESETYEFVADASGVTLYGGTPLAAWQIPFSAITGLQLSLRAGGVTLTGWVAGGHLSITVMADSLQSGTLQDLEVMCSHAAGREPQLISGNISSSRRHRTTWLIVALGCLLVVIGIVTAAALGSSSSPSKPLIATSDQQSATTARNLTLGDLPSDWGTDAAASSPLSGLLATDSSSTPTAAERAETKKILSAFQSCMGLTNATDRTFGAAGVKPLFQTSSDPYGVINGTNFYEAGTTTQLYASPASVQQDLTQLQSNKFPTCFAEALGRMFTSSGDPTVPLASLPVTRQPTSHPLGVFVSGATVSLTIPDGTSTVPAQLGVTILVHGSYEQTLFTFSTPGAFPGALQTSLTDLLAARLVGAGAAGSA